jgi:hypothetical protein
MNDHDHNNDHSGHHDHAALAAHRYARGDVVRLFRSLAMPNVADGAYTVLALLPERDGKPQYRIKSERESHERVVKEDELT